jgi:hypothetical protein
MQRILEYQKGKTSDSRLIEKVVIALDAGEGASFLKFMRLVEQLDSRFG